MPPSLSLCLVQFFPFLLFSQLSTVFFIDNETNKTIPLKFPGCFSLFLEEKLFEKNFSHCMSAKLQAPINGRNFGTKLTHLCGFWLDVSFFSQVKKHRSRFLLDVSFFFHMWKPSLLLWLARTHLRMRIYDIAFWWVFLSMYCT